MENNNKYDNFRLNICINEYNSLMERIRKEIIHDCNLARITFFVSQLFTCVNNLTKEYEKKINYLEEKIEEKNS